MWLIAIILDRTDIEHFYHHRYFCECLEYNCVLYSFLFYTVKMVPTAPHKQWEFNKYLRVIKNNLLEIFDMTLIPL